MTRTLLIADDHPVVRQGLAAILREAFEHVQITPAQTGQDALDHVKKQSWDAVILDITLPDKNGLDVLKEIKLCRPQQPVLMLSFHEEAHYALRTLKAGAAGYLTKESAPDEIVEALTRLFQGGKYVTRSLAERLAYDLEGTSTGDPYDVLSDREFEVLRLFGRGLTLSEVGDRLALSVKTVSTYRARLLQKLQLETTAQLIRYALDRKLIE